MLLLVALFLWSASLFVGRADARCWCVDYVTRSNGNGGNWVRKLGTGCEDTEMRAECLAAKDELTDWVNAVMAYARTLAQSHPGNVTKLQEAKNEAALSYAVEARRPEPDCATGLFTNTHLDDDDWEWILDDDDGKGWSQGNCISKQILKECERVRDGMEAYVKSVMSELQESQASHEFVQLMRLRIEHSIRPTIRCHTSEYHKENAHISGGRRRKSMAVLYCLVITTVLCW